MTEDEIITTTVHLSGGTICADCKNNEVKLDCQTTKRSGLITEYYSRYINKCMKGYMLSNSGTCIEWEGKLYE